MKRLRCGRVAVFAAAAALVVPPQAFAVDGSSLGPTAQSAAARTPDVSLAADGSLSGQAMSVQGQPLANETVVISDGQRHLSATTNAKGEFRFEAVRGGAYTIYTKEQIYTCRAWKAGTEPPSATRGLMLVHGDEAVLGQNRWERSGWDSPVRCGTPIECGTPVTGGAFAGFRDAMRDPVIVGGIVAAAVAIPVAITNSNDDDPAS